MKVCTKCGERRALGDYYLANGKPMSRCKECHKAAVRVRIEADPERHRAYVRKSNRTHYARTLKASREWKTRNRERMGDYRRAYVAANPEKVKEWAKRRSKQPGYRILSSARPYCVILRGDPCAYCGGPMQHIDHIDPIAEGGSRGWDNLTAACQPCNHQKYNKPLLVFLLDRAA